METNMKLKASRTIQRTSLAAGVVVVALGVLVWVLALTSDAKGSTTTGDGNWDDRFGSLGLNGNVFSLVISGTDVYVGGRFTTAGTLPASHVAKWDSSSGEWTALGSGTNGDVYDLAISDGYLYAGGVFTTAGGASANNIARWDGSQWSPLGGGTNGNVLAVGVGGGEVYAGGTFSTADGVSANNIARWDGSQWHPLDSGTNGTVFDLAVSGSNVYAGGLFLLAGEVEANGIAGWDSTNSQWYSLAGGMNDSVNTVVVSGTDVYAGGSFTKAGGTSASHIAWWDGVAWTPVGGGLSSPGYVNVYAIAFSGNDVYAGGSFLLGAGGYNLAKWDGFEWSPLGSGTNDRVDALAVIPGELPGALDEVYVGGSFARAGGIPSHHIGLWHEPPPPPPPTATGTPTATATPTPCVAPFYIIPSANVGTDSNELTAVDILSANNFWAVGSYVDGWPRRRPLIEHWDGTGWSVVPAAGDEPGSSRLKGVAAISADDVWAVGFKNFQIEYGYGTLIEHWDGTRWSIVPSPNPGSHGSTLSAVTYVSTNDVWAVGYYSDGISYWPLALRWNGSTWTSVPVPAPMHSSLAAVTAAGANDVWAVGRSYINGNYQTLTVHWNGSAWTQVPSPNPGGATRDHDLTAIEAYSPTNVWAVGGNSGPGIVGGHLLAMRWNGSQWIVVPSPVDAPVPLGVSVLADDDVWIAGNVDRHRTFAMRWDGSEWSALPTSNPGGIEDTVLYAIDAFSTDNIWTVGYYGGGRDARTLVQHWDGVQMFADVRPSDYFYEPVEYMYCHGIVSGYEDSTFRPYSNTTRSQMVKIVVLSFEIPLSQVTTPTFADVPASNPFFVFVETATEQQIVSGYQCGGEGEPCDEQNRPYFRPFNLVTRGQLSKIVVVAAGWEVIDPPNPTFSDVPPGNTFYAFVETAYCHQVISGYADGTFKPGNNATRGQIAKIVYLSILNEEACQQN